MKKIHAFQLIFAFIFLLFLIFLFMPKNYTKEYEINDVKITETYNKENKNYYFTLSYNDITFDYLIDSNYKQHRHFITDVTQVEDEDNFCLILSGTNFEFVPLCFQDNEVIHYSLVNNSLKNQLANNLFNEDTLLDTYNDIQIYNQDYTYLLWNYDGFYYLTKDTDKKIEIFEKELYTITSVAYTNNYLVIADYDSNYTFNKLYTIDFLKGNLKKYDLDYDIYFDSYSLGYVKDKLYIVDNKESQMYEFNAKNGNINKYTSQLLNRNKWEKVNIKSLINSNKEFIYETNYEYTLEDNNIYLNYYTKDIKTLITTNITSIVRIKDKDIFYLKSDTLYHFNPQVGEEKLLTYFEWNFNYEHMIYLN